MRIGIAGPLLALWLTATSASAEEPLPVHFEAGLRAGLGFPIGNAVGARNREPACRTLQDSGRRPGEMPVRERRRVCASCREPGSSVAPLRLKRSRRLGYRSAGRGAV